MSAITAFGGASAHLINSWRPNFGKIDADTSGSINKSEIKSAWQDLPIGSNGKAQKIANQMFKAADADADGSVTQGEAKTFNTAITTEVKAQMLRYQEMAAGGDHSLVFANADSDSDGGVSVEELASALEGARPEKGCQHDLATTLLAQMDKDGDGQVSAAENQEAGDRYSRTIAARNASEYAMNALKSYLTGANQTGGIGEMVPEAA